MTHDMTPDAQLALRKPFPPETVGKLPKGLKRDDPDKGKCDPGSRYSADGHFCGGYHSRSLHLDYVGHAAVTDRLLTVDPLWTWEPLALGPDGLPALDRAGNLWIKLTICGVTRLGVGDGKSAKECIGDAIRNAAMRFGVALDLWAKDDLVEFARAAAHRTDAPAPTTRLADVVPDETPTEAPTEPAPKLRTEAQSRALFAALGERGLKDRALVLAWLGDLLGRDIETTKTLTSADVSRALDALRDGVTP